MLKKSRVYKMVFSALFLALALVLPFLTASSKTLGNALCPMHIPVILCGFFCGPLYGLFVGAIAPILRFFMFGMPPVVPIGIAMSFELAAYGFFSGLFYNLLPQKKINVYVSLIGSMLLGRLIWGAVQYVLMQFGKTQFSFGLFISGAFLNAIPGIVIQILFIPILVIVLRKNEK